MLIAPTRSGPYLCPVSAANVKPIVVLHRGSAYYLPYCLAQARYSNPNAPIYLLGDLSNQDPPAGVTHYLVDAFSDEADQFSRNYVHLSSRPEAYERFCIERWFVLLAFMRRHNLTTCVHLDSDVLLYDDLSRTDDWTGGNVLQYVHWIPHVLYVNSQTALEQFCQYITEQYTNPTRLQVLRDRYEGYLAGREPNLIGISDMTLLEMYQKEYDDRTTNLLKQREFTNAVHEDNVSAVSGFRPDRWGLGKQIVWRNGLPHGYYNDRLIRFQSLHCQGYAKARMPLLATFPKWHRLLAYGRDVWQKSGPYYLQTYYRTLRYGRS